MDILAIPPPHFIILVFSTREKTKWFYKLKLNYCSPGKDEDESRRYWMIFIAPFMRSGTE
jgi:hypothetical protein